MGATPTASSGGMNPIRFMQLAFAATIFFSVVYMGQFISLSVQDSEQALTGAGGRGLMGETNFVLQGFDEAFKFVSTYDVKTQGPLYLLFMSDADANGTYWCPDCQRAKKPVYDVFARAPRGSRLAEIRVGPSEVWNDDNNAFRQNELFYLDYIPSLIRYDGGGNSSHMLNEQYTLDYDLLEYVFRVPNPAAGAPNKNQVVVLDDADAVQQYVAQFDDSYPLYIFFVSGHHAFNGRLWCPYCDRADVAIMHYFNYSAPDNAVLLRVIVSHTYKMWKKKKNPFKLPEFRSKVVSLRGVPFLGRVHKEADTNRVIVDEFKPDFTAKQELIAFFQGAQAP
ncbi:hypothetical protein ATCC90586_001557 [Pythium insidiosum]|nr:hypothetical protein ATCC90586_001557 [Pythium insidiosum]